MLLALKYKGVSILVLTGNLGQHFINDIKILPLWLNSIILQGKVNRRWRARPLKIRIRSELLLLNLLVILLIAAIILLPSNMLRIILGIPFVLFFPGYVLTATLFPKKEGVGGIERVAFSFGLSIAVVSLMGLILNYTPWGIRLESILYSMASFILIMSIIAWIRRKKLWEGERFNIEFQLRLPDWGGSGWDKVLLVVLAIAILGALGTLGYVIAIPKVGEQFTEFYILGQEEKVANYPRELKVGEEGEVVMGIINREFRAVSYRVEVRIDGVKSTEMEPLVLEHDEKWEGKISFVPQVAGENRKTEFLLYKDGEAEPCLEPLRLWVDVIE